MTSALSIGIHDARRLLAAVSLLIISVLGPAWAQVRSGEDPAELATAIQAVVRRTDTQLADLAKRRLSPDQLTEAIRSITNPALAEVSRLGQHFNALPREVKIAYATSPTGTQMTSQINRDMAAVNRRVSELTKNLSIVWVPFGRLTPDHALELTTEPNAALGKHKALVELKTEFIRAYVQSSPSIAAADRQVYLGTLAALRNRALGADAQASRDLDDLLESTVSVYPKNDPRAQYNLGYLYSELGRLEEAKLWLSRAAAQGLPEATSELARLHKPR